ncbi:unnamed protein product [Amoebophrya sp. A120]|nr:unnamed protein product [Amoebophrya sp. A120]|eukprot:GSA120T00008487001.1
MGRRGPNARCRKRVTSAAQWLALPLTFPGEDHLSWCVNAYENLRGSQNIPPPVNEDDGAGISVSDVVHADGSTSVLEKDKESMGKTESEEAAKRKQGREKEEEHQKQKPSPSQSRQRAALGAALQRNLAAAAEQRQTVHEERLRASGADLAAVRILAEIPEQQGNNQAQGGHVAYRYQPAPPR